MKNKLVSIIIPVYNCENIISETIDSIIKQSYDNIEIIIVNDGSIDKTLEICKSKMDNRIKIYTKDNGGVSSARNYGIERAHGEFIVFIDSDDYVDKNYIYELIRSKKNNDKSLIGCKIKTVSGQKQKVEELNEIYEKEEYIKNIILGNIDGFIFRYLFNAKILKKVKFDEDISYMEDLIFLLKYMKKSNETYITFINDTFYYYVENNNSITNSSSKALDNIMNIKKVEKQIVDYLKIDYYFDYNEYVYIFRKRICKNVEYIISKISNKKDYEKLKKNKEVQSYLNNLSKLNINVFYTFYYNIVGKMPYLCFELYIKARTIIKKSKYKQEVKHD